MQKARPHFFSSLTILCLLLLGSIAPRPLPAQAAAPTPPDPPKLEFVFEELVTLGPSIHPGATPFGDRNLVPITGGTFAGPRLKGKILNGGWDWQLTTKSGCFKLHADYMIQTDDGAIINILNQGTSCRSTTEKPARILTTPSFEAPVGPYDWLNGGAYVGTLDVTTVDGKPAVRIRIYKAA